MGNRSNHNLPAIYSYHGDMIADSNKPIILPLDVNDFTYLHFHDCLEIGYCVSGNGICMVDDQQYPFKKGDVQIVFPFQKHLSKNSGEEFSNWCWFTFNPYLVIEKSGFANIANVKQLISNEMGLCGIFTPEEYPEVVALVERFFRELLEKDEASSHHVELRALYIYELLVYLSRLSEPLPKLQIQQDRNLQALSNALALISQSIQNANTPSVEMLAAACKMSVSNFRKVFRKFVGLSPKDYITKCCINKAQQLLLTTHKSILEVCLESGFRDLSWFNHQFLEKANMTPSAYRKHFNKQS